MKRKEEKDKLIKNAALEEFLKKGVSSASMDEIAKISTVSKRTLYKYYPTKMEIFNSIIEDLFKQVKEIKTDIYSEEKDLKLALIKMIEVKFSFFENKDFLRLSRLIIKEIISEGNEYEYLNQKIASTEQEFYDFLLKFKSKKKKEITEKEISDYFHSLVEGLIMYPILFNKKTKFTNKEKQELKERISNIIISEFFN